MNAPPAASASSAAAPAAGRALTPPQSLGAGKQLMSATLRERLKKTRSSFNSCYAVAKRLKVDTEENNFTTEENDSTTLKKATSSTGGSCSGSPENCKNMEKASEESLYLKDPLKDIDVYSKSLVLNTPPGNLPEMVSEGQNIGKKELHEEKVKLLKQVQEKEELLRRLKLVKMYRSKNDLSQLQSLIKKWRNSCQLLLFELQSTLSVENKKLSLTQLMDSYGLEDQLLHYNRTEEEFVDF